MAIHLSQYLKLVHLRQAMLDHDPVARQVRVERLLPSECPDEATLILEQIKWGNPPVTLMHPCRTLLGLSALDAVFDIGIASYKLSGRKCFIRRRIGHKGYILATIPSVLSPLQAP